MSFTKKEIKNVQDYPQKKEQKEDMHEIEDDQLRNSAKAKFITIKNKIQSMLTREHFEDERFKNHNPFYHAYGIGDKRKDRNNR